MKPYFDSPEKLAALVAASERWLGTPFRENSAIPGPGGGVACHTLYARLYFATGVLTPFDVPKGHARRLLHNPADTIIEYLDAHFPGRFAAIDLPESPKSSDICAVARPGDTLIFREGRIGKHIGIVLPGSEPHHAPRFVHVLRPGGVQITALNDPTYGDAILAIRRPMNGSQDSGVGIQGKYTPDSQIPPDAAAPILSSDS